MRRPSVLSVFFKTFISGLARLLNKKTAFYLYSKPSIQHQIYLCGIDESYPKSFSIHEIERIFKIKYTPFIFFESYYAFSKVQYYCKKFEAPREALWAGAFYKKEIEAGYIAPVYIAWTGNKKKWGLFSSQFIGKESFIGEYAGRVELISAFFNNLTPYSFHYPLPFECLLWFTINPAKYGNETRFMNHSDNPNCRSVVMFHQGIYRIGICALRDISRGEELTFDYGLTVWGGIRTFKD